MNDQWIVGRVASEVSGVAVVVIDGEIIILDAVETLDDGVISRAVVPMTKSDAIALSLLLIQAVGD